MNDTEAQVRAHLVWPDRGELPFERSVQPTGRAVLVGFSSDIYLERSDGGVWRYVRRGITRVSE